MSASGSNPGGDRPGQGLTKFIRRASKVLRPRSTRDSFSGSFDAQDPRSASVPAPAAAAAAAVGGPSAGAATLIGDAGASDEPRVDTEPPRVVRTPLMLSLEPTKSAAAYNKLREDKARAMFSKYGMTLRPGDWTKPRAAAGAAAAAATPSAGAGSEWVEKKIVMRIHRTCHRCQTTFGADKLCANCNHTRCKKCPRFPTKRPKEQRKAAASGVEEPVAVAATSVAGAAGAAGAAAGAAAVVTTTIEIDPNHTLKARIPVISAGTTRDGRDLVRRHPVQRVRRTCHRCDTLFAGKAVQCGNCSHQRCPNCPRDPPKLKKHQAGYPGDVEETFPLAKRTLKPARLRYRWECHECNRAFIEHEKTCRGCQHGRCNDCPRKPPKKAKKEHRSDVVASVEDKLAQLTLRPAS